MKKTRQVLFLIVCVPVLMGLTLPQCMGLWKTDFERISENGFEFDERNDKNSYAWSMEYFVPDNAEEGHLYVGTGNNLGGLLIYGIEAVMNGEDPREGAPIRPPELRRYRPDLGPMEWERLVDYRDVEAEGEYSTIGFRMMKVYRAQSDGVNYLYAATMGSEPKLWRTSTGEPGEWSVVAEFEVGSIRWMEVHRGLLYLAIATDIPGTDLERIGRVWATDGETMWTVIDDGFGNPDNLEVECLTSFNGWLYAGTLNQTTGYEVWKFAGPQEDAAPIQIVANGGPDSRNDIAGTPKIFKGKLYIGSLIFQGGINVETWNGFKGCDIIRIDENDNWETVVGKDSISGYDSGFNYFTNAYCWMIEEHEGWLYAGTYDQSAMIKLLLQNFPRIFGSVLGTKAAGDYDFLDFLLNNGADIYKSYNGEQWFKVCQDGMGNTNNYGIRTMKSVGPYMYLGTANNNDGLEIWRSVPSEELPAK